MDENILSENEIVEEIPGEILDIPGEIVEELPQDNDIEIVEELPEETFEDMGTLSGEDTEILSDDILVEENENELLEEVQEPEANDNDQTISAEVTETDQAGYEEEILSYLETLTTSSEIIQQNCKTGIENLQLLSTCSLAVECMILGGVVIFCYLNRLG